jgi:hypothetical protein
LDQALGRLNAQYLAYKQPTREPAACLPPDCVPAPDLHPHVLDLHGKQGYFIRCVIETAEAQGIEVLKLHVPVDAGFPSQFVLARLDLHHERLDVFYEQEGGSSHLIHSQPFAIKFSQD